MLSPRLNEIVALLGKNGSVADIGCDHGKLSAYLINGGLAEFVYATDISEPSLEKAKKLAKNNGLKNISFLLGNGFEPLKSIPDAAVIAGMGGEVISKLILHPFAKTKLVLQPMKDSEILYKTLAENGFEIEKVVIVREDRRFYEIICAKPGRQKKFDYQLPPIDKTERTQNAIDFYKRKLLILERAYTEAQNAKNQQGVSRAEEIKERIQVLNEVIDNG